MKNRASRAASPFSSFALFAILLVSRLCEVDILWADEDYHQAAALQLLHGKALYRDLWYDKPPLNAYTYLLFHATGGAVLRTASAIYALLVCLSAFHFARRLWSEREGYIAAMLAAFSLIFYFPSATITLEPDTLMLLPHLCGRFTSHGGRRPFIAGLLSGVAMLFNVKAIFVLAACAVVGFGAGEFASLAWLALGFLIPNAAALAWLAATGALAGYVEQVWRWGFLYAGSSSPMGAGIERLANWAAFHAVLVLATIWCWWNTPEGRFKWIAWTLTAVAASAIGLRFLPRYLDQLLPPPLIIAASRGVTACVRLRKAKNLASCIRDRPVGSRNPVRPSLRDPRVGDVARCAAYLDRYLYGSRQPRGRRNHSRHRAARRNAFRVGISSEYFRVLQARGRVTLLGFSAAHGRGGGSPSGRRPTHSSERRRSRGRSPSGGAHALASGFHRRRG